MHATRSHLHDWNMFNSLEKWILCSGILVYDVSYRLPFNFLSLLVSYLKVFLSLQSCFVTKMLCIYFYPYLLDILPSPISILGRKPWHLWGLCLPSNLLILMDMLTTSLIKFSVPKFWTLCSVQVLVCKKHLHVNQFSNVCEFFFLRLPIWDGFKTHIYVEIMVINKWKKGVNGWNCNIVVHVFYQ